MRIGPAFCFPRDFPLRRCWGWYAIEVHWPRQCWGLVLTSMATWLSFWCRASFLRRRDHNDICYGGSSDSIRKNTTARRRGAYVAKGAGMRLASKRWGLVCDPRGFCAAFHLRRRDHNDIGSKWLVIGQHPKNTIAPKKGGLCGQKHNSPRIHK